MNARVVRPAGPPDTAPTVEAFHDHCKACGWTYVALSKPTRDHWLYGPLRDIHDRHEEEAQR